MTNLSEMRQFGSGPTHRRVRTWHKKAQKRWWRTVREVRARRIWGGFHIVWSTEGDVVSGVVTWVPVEDR